MCDCVLFFPHFPQHKDPDSFQSNLLNCATESLILTHIFCSVCAYVDIDTGPLKSGKLLLLFLFFGIITRKCIRPYVCLPDVLIAVCSSAIWLPPSPCWFSFVSFKAVYSQCRGVLYLTFVFPSISGLHMC